MVEDEDGYILLWLVNGENDTDVMNTPHRFVVYCFADGEKVDIENPEHIMSITANRYFRIPREMKGNYLFVVTVLDRLQNESKGVKCKVKL